MKITKELAELSEGTVQLLSLVKTGANATPFKRLKSDTTEGDVDVFTPEKTRTIEDQPQLIALAVPKDGDVDAAKALAKLVGVTIHDEREIEGTTLLITKANARVNTLDPEQIQIQLSEELIAVCQVEKSFIPFTGTTSFADAIKAQGFFPQLSSALETFGSVTFQILEGAETPAAAALEIQKAGEEFTSLVASMTKALPKETFKMATELKPASKEETKGDETKTKTETPEGEGDGKGKESLAKKDGKDSGKGKDTGAAADESAADGKTIEKEGESAEDGKGKKGKKVEKDEKPAGDETAAADEGKGDGEKKVEKTEPDLAQILTAIETLGKAVAAQGEAHTALKDQVEEAVSKADAAEAAATVATDAMKGRVSRSPAPDGRRKDEGPAANGSGPPLQDTGLANLHKR